MSTAHKRRILVAIALAVFFILGATAPYQQRISAGCVIRPAAVWSLKHMGSGMLSSGIDQNHTGMAARLHFYQLERPDVFDLKIAPGLRDGHRVEEGDTLAFLHSRGAEIRTNEYEDEMFREQRRRESLTVGSREEEVTVARQRVERARIRLESFQSVYDRALALRDSNLVSEARFDETEARYRELEAELLLAEAELRSSETGAHPAEISVVDADIARLDRLVESSRTLLAVREPIVTPFSGVFRSGEEALGRILSVQRSDSFVVRIHLPETFAGDIPAGTAVSLSFPALSDLTLEAALVDLQFLEGDTLGAFATAILGNESGRLKPGMTGTARIPLGRATLFERLGRQFNSVRN